MIAALIWIDAQSPGGEPLPVRLASHDVPELCHFGGWAWDAALVQMPDFALDFFGGGFAGQVTAPRTGFAATMLGVAGFASVPSQRAVFADARVRIWVGSIEPGQLFDPQSLVLRFAGRIAAEPEVDDLARVARFEAAVQDGWADEPMLDLFAGTGGIEGPIDLAGQPKPLALGNVRFASGKLINNVDNVWMVSGGAVEGVSAVYDRLASLGASFGNTADLAALLAAEIPNGSWATCHALGLVRTGAPPDGRISFDVQGSNSGVGGYVRTPGAIMRRLADLAGGAVNAASLAALDAARPYNLQIDIAEQTTAREVIASIADSVAAVAGVSLTGDLFAQPLAIGWPGEVLNADGSSALRVASVEELAKDAPAWRLATEAELTFEVHSADEAAFGYRWQGPWSAARVYRVDDVVTGPDGAAWVYVNATAAAGQALPVHPAQSNAYWLLFGAAGAISTTGLRADLPASGSYVGQTYTASDTGELLRWDGTVWQVVSDVTAEAARSIEPQFSVIEIRKFELGNAGTRAVSHFAKRGDVAIGGGTWSLPQKLLGSGTATVNASTGLVSLSGITQSGSYTIRYTHTDGVATELKINVSFIDQAATVRSINASPSVATWFQGSTTSRIVAHTAIEGSSTLNGGTWSLVSSTGITASINSSTGALTISNATESGTYRIRYTHTDAVETEFYGNLIYYPSGQPSRPTDPNYNEP